MPAPYPGLHIHFTPASTSLPIWKIHAEILRTLHVGNRLVFVAPPGSGHPHFPAPSGPTNGSFITDYQTLCQNLLADLFAWVFKLGTADIRREGLGRGWEAVGLSLTLRGLGRALGSYRGTR